MTPSGNGARPDTQGSDEDGLRRWLVDYLVTNLGCSPEQIDRGASMHDLGLASRDAVVLTGELSEFLGRVVSPVEFWLYPTVNALARVRAPRCCRSRATRARSTGSPTRSRGERSAGPPAGSGSAGRWW